MCSRPVNGIPLWSSRSEGHNPLAYCSFVKKGDWMWAVELRVCPGVKDAPQRAVSKGRRGILCDMTVHTKWQRVAEDGRGICLLLWQVPAWFLSCFRDVESGETIVSNFVPAVGKNPTTLIRVYSCCRRCDSVVKEPASFCFVVKSKQKFRLTLGWLLLVCIESPQGKVTSKPRPCASVRCC
jgi:hypothetical protein